MVVDVTESPTHAPEKKQRRYYSAATAGRIILPADCLGKKKRHTLKAQVVVDQTSRQIICPADGTGRVDDLGWFQTSGVQFLEQQLCLADKGYQGIAKLHPNSCPPTKKPRQAKLSEPERQHNHSLTRLRVVAAQINRRLKIFRILAERYRNRRRRFGLCLS